MIVIAPAAGRVVFLRDVAGHKVTRKNHADRAVKL